MRPCLPGPGQAMLKPAVSLRHRTPAEMGRLKGVADSGFTIEGEHGDGWVSLLSPKSRWSLVCQSPSAKAGTTPQDCQPQAQ